LLIFEMTGGAGHSQPHAVLGIGEAGQQSRE